MTYVSNSVRWLQRKKYQYEVTFSLYMLTPTEKFIFNTFLLLFISMIIVAASMYLPEHIATMLNRAWFYFSGEEAAAVNATTDSKVGIGIESLASMVRSTGDAVTEVDRQGVTSFLDEL